MEWQKKRSSEVCDGRPWKLAIWVDWEGGLLRWVVSENEIAMGWEWFFRTLRGKSMEDGTPVRFGKGGCLF